MSGDSSKCEFAAVREAVFLSGRWSDLCPASLCAEPHRRRRGAQCRIHRDKRHGLRFRRRWITADCAVAAPSRHTIASQ